MNLYDLSAYGKECRGKRICCDVCSDPNVQCSLVFSSFEVRVNTRVIAFHGQSCSMVLNDVKRARLIQEDGDVTYQLSVETGSQKKEEHRFLII